MLKLFGAAIVVIATTWTGFEAARHYSERTKQLRQLKGALQTLDAEIMFGHTPLHEAARQLAKQIPKPLSQFFASFADKLTEKEITVKLAWEASLEEVWDMTSLTKSDFEIMRQFGETLGRHDRISQQKQIMLTVSHLEREELEATDRQHKYEKMIKSLGFLLGLLLIILLM